MDCILFMEKSAQTITPQFPPGQSATLTCLRSKLINNRWAWRMMPERMVEPRVIWAECLAYPWQSCTMHKQETKILTTYIYHEKRGEWAERSLTELQTTRSPGTNTLATPPLWETAGQQYCLMKKWLNITVIPNLGSCD